MDEELSNKIMTILADNKNLSQAEAENILAMIKHEMAGKRVEARPLDNNESTINNLKAEIFKTSDFREKARLAAEIISLRNF